MTRRFALAAAAGFVFWTAAAAHAQGWYNYTVPGAPGDSAQPAQPIHESYNGLLLSPGGGFYSGSVNSYSANLGDGVSMTWFTTVLNGAAGESPWMPGNMMQPGFSPSLPTSYLTSPAGNMGAGAVANTGGLVSVGLGGGLSMDFVGALSRMTDSPYYFGPGMGLDNRMSTTVGTGFTMNFGHGGSLSIIGSVSRAYGAGFGTRSCGPIFAACR